MFLGFYCIVFQKLSGIREIDIRNLYRKQNGYKGLYFFFFKGRGYLIFFSCFSLLVVGLVYFQFLFNFNFRFSFVFYVRIGIWSLIFCLAIWVFFLGIDCFNIGCFIILDILFFGLGCFSLFGWLFIDGCYIFGRQWFVCWIKFLFVLQLNLFFGIYLIQVGAFWFFLINFGRFYVYMF